MKKSWAFIVLVLLLSGARIKAAVQEKRLEFTFPELSWTLTIPADDFQVAQRQMRNDGRGAYYYLVDEKQGLNLSMYIEPVKDCKDSKSCRDLVWKLGNPEWGKPENVVQNEIGEVSVLELMVPKYQGMDVRQQNVYAEFVVDGFWVDMHISKVRYKPEEHRLFEQIIKAVKFEPKGKPTNSPLSPDAPADQPKAVTAEGFRKFEDAIKPYVEQARKTYPEAKQRYLGGLPPKHVFFVTARLFDASGRFEQVFVEVKEIKRGIIRGVIASEMNVVKTYKYGDEYSLPEFELIDWTISKPDGTEEGNFVGKFLDTYRPD
ncbi:MAG TPA: hypothetical protein VE863_05515 [Pyrinomonadaceae bacterium]|jgi:hypothetical protein|nr:hypothetical protein [Pyrinomonadaceae bacterium]